MKKRKIPQPGLSPGTLIYTGEYSGSETILDYIGFNPQTLEEKSTCTTDEVLALVKAYPTTWFNITGLSDVERIREISDLFNIHPLTQEDILSVSQRAKLDDYQAYLFAVLKMVYFEDNKLQFEHISLVLSDQFLLSFQEKKGDVFEPIRRRLRIEGSRIRERGNDYMMYTLIDAIVDHYFIVIEKLGNELEELEDEIIENPEIEVQNKILQYRKQLLKLRRAIYPIRELIAAIKRAESPLIKKTTHRYLEDVYDHAIQVMETLESHRDILSGMMDLYMSNISQRMNNIMKVLTIIATIFIPLTFIAGIYGMNFEHMPELEWQYGYAAIWLIMVCLFLSMIFFFRKKKWL